MRAATVGDRRGGLSAITAREIGPDTTVDR